MSSHREEKNNENHKREEEEEQTKEEEEEVVEESGSDITILTNDDAGNGKGKKKKKKINTNRKVKNRKKKKQKTKLRMTVKRNKGRDNKEEEDKTNNSKSRKQESKALLHDDDGSEDNQETELKLMGEEIENELGDDLKEIDKVIHDYSSHSGGMNHISMKTQYNKRRISKMVYLSGIYFLDKILLWGSTSVFLFLVMLIWCKNEKYLDHLYCQLIMGGIHLGFFLISTIISCIIGCYIDYYKKYV